jgi:hypothetical protein
MMQMPKAAAHEGAPMIQMPKAADVPPQMIQTQTAAAAPGDVPPMIQMPRVAAAPADAPPPMIQMPMAAAGVANVQQMIQMLQTAAAAPGDVPMMIQMLQRSAAAPGIVPQMIQMPMAAAAPPPQMIQMPRAACGDVPQMIQMPMAAAAPGDVPQMIQMPRVAAAPADAPPPMTQMPSAAATPEVRPPMVQMPMAAAAPADAPKMLEAKPKTKQLVMSQGRVFPVKEPPPGGPRPWSPPLFEDESGRYYFDVNHKQKYLEPPRCPRPPQGPPPLFEDETGRYYFDVNHKKKYLELFGTDARGNPIVLRGGEVDDVLEEMSLDDTEDEYCPFSEDDKEGAEGDADQTKLRRAMADLIDERGQLTDEATAKYKAMQEEDEEKDEKPKPGRKEKFRAGRRVQAQRLKKLMQEVYGIELTQKKQKGGSKGKGKQKGSAWPARYSGWNKKGSSSSSSTWHDWR